MTHINPAKPRDADEEFYSARQLLIDNGFSKAGVVEMLTKRWKLRDDIAVAALQSIIASDGIAADEAQMERDADTAYRYAKAMMNRRGME